MTGSSTFFILLQVFSFYSMLVAMPTCQLEGHLVQSAHDLLHDLGGHFPIHCLPYNTNMSLPESALPVPKDNRRQCRQALWVVSESLKEAALIMEDETPVGEGGVTWNAQKFDDFQNIQYQVMEQGLCLTYDDTSVLSSYFSNVTAIVQQQDIAACGWMALKRDLLRILKFTLQKHHTCFTWRDQY